MARPARVLIRRRKPWVRLRRRRLGWKVRLLTGGLPYLRGQRWALHYRPRSLDGGSRQRSLVHSDLPTVRGCTNRVKPSTLAQLLRPPTPLRRVQPTRRRGPEKPLPWVARGQSRLLASRSTIPPVAIPPCHEVEEIRAWLSHATLPGREVGPGYCPPLHAQGVDKCVE